MGIAPILDVASQLILPVYFLIFKGSCITLWHLLNDLDGNILIATPPSSIMMSQTPCFLFDFLLMVTVSHLKGGLTFPNILPLAFFTGGKVNYKTACTIYFLPNPVSSACICAFKTVPLFDYWAGNLASITFSAARVFIMGFSCIFLSYHSFEVSWLAKTDLNIISNCFCPLIFDKAALSFPQPLVKRGIPLIVSEN